MMTPSVETLRVESRRLASHGRWEDVRALLGGHPLLAREHAECVRLLGEALLRVGEPREARRWLGAELPRLQSTQDRISLRMATVLSGAANLELGQLDEARGAFERTLELARYDRDEALVARAMNNLGIVANIEGRWDEALALYHLAVSVHQRIGDTRGMAECYHNMAITHRDRGELAESDELERRSAEFGREAAQERLVALARLGRAEIALRRGDAALAVATARRLALDFERLGDPIRQADAVRLSGLSAAALGDFDRATADLQVALEMSRRHGALLNEAETLRACAEVHRARGDAAAAQFYAQAALEKFEELGATREVNALLLWMRSTS